jgi:short subunit dehydrogenase-like uncharacterized protein
MATTDPGGETGREHDLVLFGASSFVGRLTAEYLAKAAPAGVKIALAGRSREKLAKVRGGLPASAGQWPIVLADSGDEDSLANLAASTRVVVTTVGPYLKYGLPLVLACAEAATDYADLTGETLFVRRSIDQAHDTAAGNGARIVHSCGFDSVPSDLSVLALHEAAKKAGAGGLGETTLTVTAMRGGFSGGTIDSMKVQLDEGRKDRDAKRLAADPYALSPNRAEDPEPRSEPDTTTIARDPETGEWLAPFVMSTYNTRIVRRSHALGGRAYGEGFRYREVMSTGKGPAGAVKAAGVLATLGGLVQGLSFGPTRKVLDRLLPDPGEGPSEEKREKGFFRMVTRTETESGRKFSCRVAADGDPGYKATAVMLGEAGLSLALDRDRLPDAAGVLTPATALGEVLTDRLRAAGHTYEATGD